MKKKNEIWRQIVIISVLGIVISIILGDFKPGLIFGELDFIETESIFDALSVILAVIALLIGTAYLVYRAARREDEGIWSKWDDEGES